MSHGQKRKPPVRRRAAVRASLAVVCCIPVGFSGSAPRETGPLDLVLTPALSPAPQDPRDLARTLLATDRPWQAAQVMRRYLSTARSVSPEDRVLAARAEAGWGAWDQVHRLLSGGAALSTVTDREVLFLTGRARDETGDPAGAAEAYRAFLSAPGGSEAERSAARLRLGLALLRAGERAAARVELDALTRAATGASPVWTRLLEASALASVGDTTGVRIATTPLGDGLPGLHARRARVEAARRSGDLAAVRRAATEARTWARTDATRSEFLVAAGRAAIEMGDVAAGRSALREAIGLSAATPYAREASARLRAGVMTPPDHLAVARVYRGQGLHQESLEGYRIWLAAALGTTAERRDARLEYGNALFFAERYGEVAAVLAPIASEPAARMLLARVESQSGNTDGSVRIYLALSEQLSRTPDGAQALLLAAAARHDDRDVERARELFGRVVTAYPGSDQMGLASMRLAGIAFQRGEYAEAARLWDGYLTEYPRGARSLEATYWSGRARAEMGDAAGATARFRAVREQDPASYYGALVSERLGVPLLPASIGAGPGPNLAPTRQVQEWMRGVDLLRNAGFPDEASAEADGVIERAGNDRPVLYALAEALAERGYAQRSLRLGLRLQAVEPENLRLFRILNPFPYRTLIREEARDRNLDPLVLAALIRQESLFEATVTSPAGARGLMQVMPATGRQLAEAAGLTEWDPDLLYQPEINVHLAVRFIDGNMEAFGGSLPLVFSAFNAGAHRVESWKVFPEYGRDELFTERIPFRETREYVKTLSRNLAVYRALYASGG